MSNPVKIVAILTARPGKTAELRILLEGMIRYSRAEAGSLRYDLWQDQAEPSRFVLDELYTNAGAIAAHRATPHFQTHLAKINDIAWVHDVAQDFYGEKWLSVFETARKGAFGALDTLRDDGVIKAWGLGVNRVEPIELLLGIEANRPDGFLLAGRYSLLDHDRALQRVMPTVAERGLGIVVGGLYSSGALVGGPNFEYAPIKPAMHEKIDRIRSIADRHGVSIKAAGLQFALANPAVAAVIPGASKPSRIAEDRAGLSEAVPVPFWQEPRDGRLVSPEAPLPTA